MSILNKPTVSTAKLWHPKHGIGSANNRCVRCGMTLDEIVKYDVLFCPAGYLQTYRAARHTPYNATETVIFERDFIKDLHKRTVIPRPLIEKRDKENLS